MNQETRRISYHPMGSGIDELVQWANDLGMRGIRVKGVSRDMAIDQPRGQDWVEKATLYFGGGLPDYPSPLVDPDLNPIEKRDYLLSFEEAKKSDLLE